jgi:hypothetical protein
MSPQDRERLRLAYDHMVLSQLAYEAACDRLELGLIDEGELSETYDGMEASMEYYNRVFEEASP